MLSMHMKEAEKKRHRLRADFSVGIQNVEKAAHRFSDALLMTVNEDVAMVYQNERDIEEELRSIERLIASNTTQTEQWASLIDRLTRELKEMGDVSNWLETLEKIVLEIRKKSPK